MDRYHLTFVALTRADFGLVSRWLAEPQVDLWWHDDPSPAGVEAQYGASIDGTDPTEVYLVHLDGEPVGLIQRYSLDNEPQYRSELIAVCEVPAGAWSIDYFVGAAAHRQRGLGTQLISDLVHATWSAHPDAVAFIVPVATGNRPSWRALERAGFYRFAEGELTPDNPINPPDHVIYRLDRPR